MQVAKGLLQRDMQARLDFQYRQELQSNVGAYCSYGGTHGTNRCAHITTNRTNHSTNSRANGVWPNVPARGGGVQVAKRLLQWDLQA